MFAFLKTPGLLRKDFLRALILTALIPGALIAGVLMTPGAAQAQVVDVDDLGNEVAAALNSIAAVLNARPCLTPSEKNAMSDELTRIRERLRADQLAANKAGEARSGVSYKSWNRALIRIDNYINNVNAKRREIENYPVCRTDPGSQVGWFVGGYFVKSWQDLKSAEKLAATGQQTNSFSDNKDPLGFGVIVGAKFTPWSNDIVAAPFASFEYLNMSVNHTFVGGSFLGTRSNFAATAGVKVGPQLSSGLWLYGVAGVSLLNQTLRVNFLPVVSSRDTTVPGATLGVGGAWQPEFLQGFGRPVSLFLEYQHTWWQDAKFNAPAASPAFNYKFRRQDDVIKLGFTIALDAPAPNAPVRTRVLK
ncbi:hypothetical protein [Terrarubrum flagellatum]|uniref:outer membrane protein n=1 Tax=Terrirubrum flagellatum TaxID=2895980 RepID=UPI003144DE4F